MTSTAPAPAQPTGRSRAPRAQQRRAGSRSSFRRFLRPVVPLALVLGWAAGTSAEWLSPDMFSTPADVFAGYAELAETGELWDALWLSLTRAAQGLALGTLIGVGFGVANGLWRTSEVLFDSTLQIVRAVPFLALVPLFMLWFGIDETPKIALITLACTFPNYIHTYAGVRSVDPRLLEVGRTFELSRTRLITRIVLPLALPHTLAGFRYAMGVSLLVLIGAEQINAGTGLGYLVMSSNIAFRSDLIIGVTLIFAVLGLGIDLAMRAIERLLLPWRPQAAR